jgi:purine-nucleoside phosphorylase
MISDWNELNETVGFLQARIGAAPRAGVILGSGLGDLADRMERRGDLSYGEIPHFPVSTAVGHAGRLVWGRWSGTEVVVLKGRLHSYEGYPLGRVAFPVRVMKLLGCSTLITTNAAGSLNPDLRAGSVMVVTDHINLLAANPLVGPNLERLGARFPDLTGAYDPRLVETALKIAREKMLDVRPGVLTAVSGPNYETAAEYRAFRFLGADAVGMSVIPEVIVAAHCGLQVLALAGMSDECFHAQLEPLSAEQVLATARKIAPAVEAIISGILASGKI